MAKASSTLLLCLSLLIFSSLVDTDPYDVLVLKQMYITLNQPVQLIGWKLYGGDPCGEPPWKGISCVGPSVVHIKLSGFNLYGHLKGRFDLQNLRHLDLSFNRIQGDIPFLLPPNATHIDLSSNQFSGTLPYALTFLKHLGYLNLSHNALYGELGNIFEGLPSLVMMDLAYNHLSGDLPLSLGDLKNLTSLYLQNNSFSGSVSLLTNVPLDDLFIQNNHFTGELPYEFIFIQHFWYWGNDFLRNAIVEESIRHTGRSKTVWIVSIVAVVVVVLVLVSAAFIYIRMRRKGGDYESGILLIEGEDLKKTIPFTTDPTDARNNALECIRLATRDFSRLSILRAGQDYGLEHLTWVDRVEISYVIALELQKLHVDGAAILDDDRTVSNTIEAGSTAPENGQSDDLMSVIHSFGMFLFELLTGKRILDNSKAEVDPIFYLKGHTKDMRHIIDHNMKGTCTRRMIKDMQKFCEMLWRCIQAEPDLRPTISEIVECLKDLRVLKED